MRLRLLCFVFIASAQGAMRSTWTSPKSQPAVTQAAAPTTAAPSSSSLWSWWQLKPTPVASPQPTPVASPRSWRKIKPLLLSYGGAGSVALGAAALVAQLVTPTAAATLLGFTALPGAVILAELLLLGGGRRVAEVMGGEPADASLVATAAEVASRAGLPPPAHVFEIPTDEMNAFAAGLRQSDQTVAVTRGLRQALTTRELKAVIAHEMGHLRHSHVASNMHTAVAIASLGGIYHFGRALVRSGSRERRASKSKSKKSKDDEGSPLVLGLALMAAGSVARVAGEFLRCSASRTHEFEADAVAAELYGQDAIVSALSKIDASSAQRATSRDSHRDSPLKARGGAFAHAYISPSSPAAAAAPARRSAPATGVWSRVRGAWAAVQRGLSTHPTLEERVAAIRLSMA